MTEITGLPLGPLMTNCYFVRDTETGDAVVVDPGGFSPALVRQAELVGKENVKGILLTHCHFDHIMGVAQLKRLTGAPIYLPEEEAGAPADASLNLMGMLPGEQLRPFAADVLVRGEGPLSIGSLRFQVLHTPGHTAGSRCYLIGRDLLSGDTLFQYSVGRTDFPTGNGATLLASVRRLAALPGDYQVYPGHGDATTLEAERRYNPYLQ